MPFEQVREFLNLFLNITVSETMIRETVERCGEAIIRKEELKVKVSAVQSLVSKPEKTRERLYIEADGSMIPLIDPENKGVKYTENKLAVCFTENDIDKTNPKNFRITKKKFVNSPGLGVGHFEMHLKHAALELNATTAKEVVFISDGASWLDGIRSRLFPKSVHIIDWYHAVERLHLMARQLFEEDEVAAKKWSRPLIKKLWKGKAKAVCRSLLRVASQSKSASQIVMPNVKYYLRRIDKMRYAYFRHRGYFIGSGAVESANKYLVAARLKLAGMKWTQRGAHAILKFRERIYDQTWATFWQKREANLLFTN